MRKLWTPGGYRTVEVAGFDLDGVKRDTGHTAYRTLCQILDKHCGRKVTYEEYLLKEFDHATYLATLGVKLDKEQLREEYYAIHPPDHETGPYADVGGCCESLISKGLRLFVVSASRREWVEGWFEKHGLDSHYVHVVHSGHPKAPHLKRLCSEMGVESQKTFYVGDMALDMYAAREADVIPVGITRGYAGAEASLHKAQAAVVVRTLEHLSNLVS